MIFREPEALVILGVGKNMVDSIKYWCLATRVIEEDTARRGSYRPTEIGRRLFISSGGWDPYLEDEGTLWLLHWLLATNTACATTISYAFNELKGLEFTRSSLVESLLKLATSAQAKATPNTLRRDVDVFIRSYVGGQGKVTPSVEESLDCPLAELGLLYEKPAQQMCFFARGAKDGLPDAIFLYALREYVQRVGRSSVTFDEVAYFPYGPGRVFKLDEPALAERLERLAILTAGAWQLTETAGYRQVTMSRDIDVWSTLDSYYRPVPSGDVHARG